MKAIIVNQFGDGSVLEWQQSAMPQPKRGEALIRMKAAGLNFIDIYMRSGLPRVAPKLPFIPGREGAGVVEAIGEGVTEVKPGDRVAYASGLGAYAEYSVVAADQLILLPDDLSFEQAAAFPLQGMTAHYLVNDFYQVKTGSTVLVHAAAGGVGLLLVQWLKHLGATVFGTVSTDEKARIAQAAGAHHVILYSQEDFTKAIHRLTQDQGVDYIIDGVGKSTFTKDLDTVRTCGWICIYGSASGAADALLPNALQARSITVSGGGLFARIRSREELMMRANAVIAGMQAGWLNVTIDQVLPLEEAAKAHALLESRKTTGKIVLKIE